MQYSLIKNQLLVALGDSTQDYYTDTEIQVAVHRAVQAYSEYFPTIKPIGQAMLNAAVKSGSNSIEIVGGFPAPGVQYVVGYGSPVKETVTVSAIEYTEWNTTILTLTTVLVNSYYTGMLVGIPANTNNTQVYGLQLSPGQDTYQLPLDFLKVEGASFSIAIGDRASYKASNSYYDETEVIMQQLSASGYGRSQGWSLGAGGGYPVVGNAIPNPFQTGNLSGNALVFTFQQGVIPFVSLSTPSVGTQLLTFNYYGQQTLQGINNSKMDDLTLYATWAAASAKAQQILQRGDTKVEDYVESNSKPAAAWQSLADKALSVYKSRVENTPYITSG